jgi:LL-diaminopimelate aminotransferase
MKFEIAQRIAKLPPYPFAEIDRLKNEAIAKGIDVVDMGVGDPDQPTPSYIIEQLKKSAENPKNHRYPSYSGLETFRTSVQQYYKKKFNVELDTTSEILTLIGSKEGIAHFPMAFINRDDYVMVPNPGYPVYNVATIFAGGIPYQMPILQKNK